MRWGRTGPGKTACSTSRRRPHCLTCWLSLLWRPPTGVRTGVAPRLPHGGGGAAQRPRKSKVRRAVTAPVRCRPACRSPVRRVHGRYHGKPAGEGRNGSARRDADSFARGSSETRVACSHARQSLVCRVSPSAVPEVRFDRLNEHYRDVVALSRLVLRHGAFESARGEVRASGFLVDMNIVFQEFVTQALREAMGVSNRVLCSDKDMPHRRCPRSGPARATQARPFVVGGW